MVRRSVAQLNFPDDPRTFEPVLPSKHDGKPNRRNAASNQGGLVI